MPPRQRQPGWYHGHLYDLAIDQLQRLDVMPKHCTSCVSARTVILSKQQRRHGLTF
ncbi:hypothetical protein AGR4C_Cc120218 [Agrobacterium tumefaciens str. Kerr 14]|jgi:hypothetical protein|uniref:Uncharacterized protein n=1 Tax=Agrobacterium tumefaciens str. Kerr 14 TaxID=1183424 RepID=A0A1S7NTG3_AGRTU|nr:hypothetical protein AGR4C_Cc120218 [Agrobacterium tumefaciens str. Kerr 14]CUX15826.1 hypothetical protein AGR4B_Cc60198 [Agrobacterium tumefaciens str. CFBP 5621]